MATVGGKVQCFYDVVSPWAYLGFEVITRYARQYPGLVQLELCPFFLGGVMQATGNKPPITVPAKGAYMFSDLQRSSGYFGVPLTAPANFPINTILAQRLLTVTKQSKPDHLEDLSRTLWKNLWGGAGGDITRPEDLLKCCVQVGISADEAKGLLESTQEQAVKDALKDVTEDAVKRGAFGAPTFFVRANGADAEEVMYFGSDRFHLLLPQLGVPWNGPHPFGLSRL